MKATIAVLEPICSGHSPAALLRYEDRNAMRFSIEGRAPFLTMDLLRIL